MQYDAESGGRRIEKKRPKEIASWYSTDQIIRQCTVQSSRPQRTLVSSPSPSPSPVSVSISIFSITLLLSQSHSFPMALLPSPSPCSHHAKPPTPLSGSFSSAITIKPRHPPIHPPPTTAAQLSILTTQSPPHPKRHQQATSHRSLSSPRASSAGRGSRPSGLPLRCTHTVPSARIPKVT